MDTAINIVIILMLGMLVSWLAKRLNQPAAVWLVLLGVVIGPPMLGWIETNDTNYFIGELGVVLLLGMAGLHIGLGQLKDAGMPGIWVALSGILFCFAGGFAFTSWWGSPFEESLYVGTILTATSIGVSVQVLQQYGLIDHNIGRVVIAAAVIDDVIALYLLAVAHGVLTDGLSVGGFVSSIVIAGVVLVAVFVLCRTLTRALVIKPVLLKPGVTLFYAVVLMIVTGLLTQKLGYSAVVGSFFAGLGIGEVLPANIRQRLLDQFSKFIFILVPFFFVLIGARAQWDVLHDPDMPTLFIGLTIVAIIGKVIGGALGAYSNRRVAQRLLIGASMVPRGEIALVAAGLGFTQGHITHHVLIALILVVITIAVTGPLIVAVLARYSEDLRN